MNPTIEALFAGIMLLGFTFVVSSPLLIASFQTTKEGGLRVWLLRIFSVCWAVPVWMFMAASAAISNATSRTTSFDDFLFVAFFFIIFPFLVSGGVIYPSFAPKHAANHITLTKALVVLVPVIFALFFALSFV